MSVLKIYGRYSEDGPRPVFASKLPSATKQQFASEADINTLIARYQKTGSFYNPLVPSGTPRVPQFVDVSEVGDVQEQMNTIVHVQDMFMALPARVREMFGHNPATFVSFASDPANFAKCVELGIFEKPVATSPTVNGQPVEPEKSEPGQSAQPAT